MIPPSMMMIIYALFTQQSIGKLFAAGIVPGLLTVGVYVALIIVLVKRRPELAPEPGRSGGDASIEGRMTGGKAVAALRMWPVLLIATLVLGGIYSGWFTPTEAAAVGALATLAFGLLCREFRGAMDITAAMQESANVTAMLFLINIGALFYSRVLSVTRLPTELTMMLLAWDVPALAILLGVLAIMFFLGMIMVPIGIYALTLPIVVPVLVNLGYDPVWFGVIALKLTEMGAITPPVGLNVFAVKGVVPKDMNVSIETVYKGCLPFLFCDLLVLILLVAFPQLSLWLPELLLG
jgi:C4-dicarboxylate transporter, DctM subunit